MGIHVSVQTQREGCIYFIEYVLCPSAYALLNIWLISQFSYYSTVSLIIK